MKKLMAIVVMVLAFAISARGDTFGDLRKAGIESDGKTVSIASLSMGFPHKAVSLTSPIKTINASGLKTFTVVTVQVDANLTGALVNHATTGTVLILISGSGSNTLRYDDAAGTMDLGGNITLTEGQGDVLCIECTGMPTTLTNNWRRWFNADN
jgi:hypothetical protein